MRIALKIRPDNLGQPETSICVYGVQDYAVGNLGSAAGLVWKNYETIHQTDKEMQQVSLSYYDDFQAEWIDLVHSHRFVRGSRVLPPIVGILQSDWHLADDKIGSLDGIEGWTSQKDTADVCSRSAPMAQINLKVRVWVVSCPSALATPE